MATYDAVNRSKHGSTDHYKATCRQCIRGSRRICRLCEAYRLVLCRTLYGSLARKKDGSLSEALLLQPKVERNSIRVGSAENERSVMI